jgi:2,4-dichlorophenol 6-monooxygenase
MTPEFETDVLVIGLGPSGACTALALADQGVRVHAISRANWLADTPRAHITNQRAVEVLRDLGLEEEARKYATPWEWMGDTLFTTSLAGPEIARLRTWGTGEERIGDYLQASPCTMLDLPQTHLEPLLVKHAAARGASLAFNTEYLAHTQDDSGVTTTLRDRLSGREYAVRSRYLVGADGARSRVVEDAGLTITGQHARAGTMYVLFSADLAHLAAHRPSILYWIVTDSASFGEIGQGVLRAIRPWNQWIAGWGFDLAQGEPQLSEAQIIERIRVLVGDPDLHIRIDMQSIWYVNQAWAPHYAKGRVFCAGDAVHRHPPSSGLGSNTCLQDAHNLAWKLAYVIKGHAGPGLLDSYSLERAPVGEQVVARANQSRLDYAPLNACFRDAQAAQPVRAGLASLTDPGPAGVARRERLAEALRLKHYEFNALGTEANHRYVSCAVVADDALPEEVWKHDRQLHAQPTTRPGAKLPHAWLVGSDGRRVSTLDLVGKGRFTLLTGIAGQPWAQAARDMEWPFLRVIVVGEEGARDPYFNWARLRDMAEAGALLVRPDGVVAWRQSVAAQDLADAHMQLRSALQRILAR